MDARDMSCRRGIGIVMGWSIRLGVGMICCMDRVGRWSCTWLRVSVCCISSRFGSWMRWLGAVCVCLYVGSCMHEDSDASRMVCCPCRRLVFALRGHLLSDEGEIEGGVGHSVAFRAGGLLDVGVGGYHVLACTLASSLSLRKKNAHQ